MSIYRKVQEVERLFQNLEKDIATFQQATGLGCKTGCGLCCMKPDIYATPLEFLPLGYYLYKTNQMFIVLDQLKQKAAKCMHQFEIYDSCR